MRSKGTEKCGESWLRRVIQWTRTALLVLQGFQYRYAKLYLNLQHQLGAGKDDRQVMRAMPLNGASDKMFEDLLSTKLVLTERAEVFPQYCAISMARGGKTSFASLEKDEWGEPFSFESFLAHLSRNERLLVRPCKNALFGKAHVVQRCEEQYWVDQKQVRVEQLKEWFDRLPSDTILLQELQPASDVMERYGGSYPVLHIRVLNRLGTPLLAEQYMAEHGDTDGIRLYGSGKIAVRVNGDDPRVTAAMGFMEHLCRKFPEVEYANGAFVLLGHGFSVFQVDTGLDLCGEESFPDSVQAFIEERRNGANGHALPFWRICRRYIFALISRRKGFVNFMYRNWLRGLREDNALKDTGWREKRWAHKRGFYSYRIYQYGLTEDNYRQFLSDYDYKRMRPLNNQYRKWFWDKLFTYYVLEAFPGYMPAYYARIIPQGKKRCVVPFSGWTTEQLQPDVISLLRQKGKLAVKPSIGSHGKGFHKLEYCQQTQQYLIDDCVASVQQVQGLIDSLQAGSLICQYVDMHQDLKRIYEKVVCTIRIMAIQNHNGSPVKHAYMRIGTSSTGRTDNLASGGIAVPVDVQTGGLGTPEILKNHRFSPCFTHPDTHAEISGEIPHWQEIKAAIEKVCGYFFALEYLGFDVAVTQDGFKILEINTHQDLHKYPDYPQEVKEYLESKRERL